MTEPVSSIRIELKSNDQKKKKSLKNKQLEL